MLLPDENQPRPTPDEIRWMWAQPMFTEIVDDPRTPVELLDHFGHIFSGGDHFFASYTITPSWHFNWFFSRNRLEEIRFCENFLASAVMPEAPGKPADQAVFEQVKWQWTNAYVLDGEFAATLMGGGVYGEFPGNGAQAKAVGEAACGDLFGDRYEDMLIFATCDAWSPWFSNYGHNMTWIGVDKTLRSAWVICTTDAS